MTIPGALVPGRADPVIALETPGPHPAEAVARVGRAWRELRRGRSANALLEDLLGGHVNPGSIEQGQLDVLDVLSVRDNRRMSDLAATLGIDPSTATRTLQRMETVGLARRCGDSEDGRAVTVHLTDLGLVAHASVTRRRTEMLTGILDVFTSAELEQLADLLDRLVEALDAAAVATTGGDRGGPRAPG